MGGSDVGSIRGRSLSEAHARRHEASEGTEEVVAEVAPAAEVPARAEPAPGDLEAPAEESDAAVLDVERLASLLTGEGRDQGPSDAAETAPSLHGYHEWHLQRLQRRLRLLTWALVAFVVLAASAIGYLLATPAPTSDGSAAQVADDLERLEAELGSLEGARDQDQGAVGSLTTSLERMEASIARIDRRLQDLTRCMNGAISGLDKDMRALLERNISANAFVRRPVAGGCRIRPGSRSP
jgi:hypothetical protein